MRILYLQPSHIRYSQDSINNYFDSKSRHSNTLIGETLDELCEGRCRIEDIENISVVKKDRMWFTADNRRLWVFKHLERLRKCTKIPVYESNYIPYHKFTTLNNGESVIVRRNPGGRWYREPTPRFNDIASIKIVLSERHTKIEHPLPSRFNQEQVNTQTTAGQKPLLSPPNRGEIQFTAMGGINTATKEQEMKEPRFQVHETFDHSVRINSNTRSSDIQYGYIIPTSADHHGDDVHILAEEQKEQVPDKIRSIHMMPKSKREIYNSGNLDCCLCIIL
ncbi:hypothetical protein CHS0354_032087 [Potamilus streckersoni]|uniref:Uncharacterized protein n=1 Tax=Potamilus streckersoni TaxID=2493646 RepID=A0AAE0TL84_9BIVA|nr:hypothetical protein CHS0354_032087 [Potamilus streckersoni]